MSQRVVLTPKFIDKLLRSPPRVPPGRRPSLKDAIVPGLSVRITDKGHLSYVMTTRYPARPGSPSRRLIGVPGRMSLAEAREKARAWFQMIERGTDPREEEQKRHAEAARRRAHTFGSVAAAFVARKMAGKAKVEVVRRMIEREFTSRWRDRPVTEIRREEVAATIRAIAERGTRAAARNALAQLRHLFGWAVSSCEFGIETSPADKLDRRALIGDYHAVRDRVLSDKEIRLIWAGAGKLDYPLGAAIRMLLLTGQRREEIARMRWSEIDLDKAEWKIPGARMKTRRQHLVPLAPETLRLLRGLPRFVGGDFVFSTTGGAKPINASGRAKARVDRAVAAAAARAGLPAPEPWVIHDLRRTMRTRLSALPIEDRVREAMIAHAPPGLHKVYDLHSYQSEKRRGFELWERALSAILSPAPAGVADIAAARGRRNAALGA